ncbi:ATP-binding protein [Saccharothrix sp. HUAS TT1]|uniref:ATP-binding protein n=1 Tax=unclassified Saccharothrix TaxID=2593673 RepID=UPI00345BE0C6
MSNDPDGHPGDAGGDELDLRDRPAMASVRRWAARTLPEVTGETLDDLLLVVNEMVGNAYDHGDRPKRLRLRRTPAGRVRVEVQDSSTSLPVPGRSRIADSRGRGVLLIAALSESWGTVRDPDGKTVWAEVATPPVDGSTDGFTDGRYGV